MKTIAIIICTLVFTLGTSRSSFSQNKNGNKKDIQEVKIKTAAHCGSCKAKIEKEIAFERGVKYINVDLVTKVAHIKYRADKTTDENLLAAIQKMGYKSASIIPKGQTVPDKPLPKNQKGMICPSKTK